MAPSGSAGLDTSVPGLLATPPAPLPYLAGVTVRSFLLRRPQGNVLVYNSPGIAAGAAAIRSLGGAARLLVNHEHESLYGAPRDRGPGLDRDGDRVAAARSLPITGTFTGRQMIDEDLEVIPVPGHTPGATAYLWDDRERRCLFTGDSLWLDRDDRWSAVVLASSDRTACLESLALLRDTDFDVLVPWVSRGTHHAGIVTRGEARQRIDAVIARVRAGETT